MLFSHIDIKGSFVTPQHILDEGVDIVRLSNNFKKVINGHLHSPQSFNGGSVLNIGASTSLSFSDNSEYIPHVAIVDSNSLNITYFNNPYAIRFIKLDHTTPDCVKSFLNWAFFFNNWSWCWCFISASNKK